MAHVEPSPGDSESYKYQYEYENMSGGKEVKDVQYIYVSAEAGKYGPLPASTPSVKSPIPNVMASTYRVKCKYYPS